MMRNIMLLVFGISILWHNQSAESAADPWRGDTRFLPQYCKDRVKGISSAEFNKWRGTFGEVYIHIHHYCGGLYAEQKARSTINQQERSSWLGNVIGEMRYVGGHCGPGCVLYPELQSRWGWALGEQGQLGEAIQHYQLAIKAKPRYASAYAQLSDLYVKNKQPDEARKVLESGLKAKPGSRMLQKRLQKLDPTQ
ncbi:tetratricopeptide repeat protein [Gammaproteobacteria bacterium]|nr:tetratricopeptide repeat protein [Gammaproteobacteria bacterium]